MYLLQSDDIILHCISLSPDYAKIFSGGKVPNFDPPNRPMTLKRINFSRIKKEAVIDFRVPFAILRWGRFLSNSVEKTSREGEILCARQNLYSSQVEFYPRLARVSQPPPSGRLMESRGLSVSLMKLDPYINVDPGTMNPFQHGEVFVTDDGAETDLDLGHYERFTHAQLGKKNNYTSGGIYYSVIMKERRGEYLGGTVQVIPHITDEIKSCIRGSTDHVDVVIVEIGGTVGDIESLPFLEAIRQFRNDVGRENAIFIHVTLVPYLPTSGEVKTKPTQHSVKELRSIGIQPDILLCRTEKQLSAEIKGKIAHFCNVDTDGVITAKDVDCIYEVPLLFHQEGLDEKIVKLLNIWTRAPILDDWQKLVAAIKNPALQRCELLLSVNISTLRSPTRASMKRSYTGLRLTA